MANAPQDDQNQRELSYANQKEDTPRSPVKEGLLSEEESAALAAWRRRLG